MSPVDLLSPQDYQAETERRFALVFARLRYWLPQARIEHIGSSALIGALSKGDLDIGLVVPGDALEGAVALLVTQGYREKANTLRTPALCMMAWHEPGLEHAVQVFAQGSKFEHLFLGFRDRLRARPDLLEAYNRLKAESAPLGAEGYRAAKSQFIEAVLASPN